MPQENYEVGRSRFADAIQLLDLQGEVPFQENEIESLLPVVEQEIKIKVFAPTFLKTNEPGFAALPIGETVLSSEAGGTQVRVRVGKTNKAAHVSQLSGVEQPFPYKEFHDPDHFFRTITSIGAPIINMLRKGKKTHAYDFVYSWPAKFFTTTYGVDAKPDPKMPKGFVVPFIETVNAGEMLWKHYRNQGLSIPDDSVMIVSNDAACGLLNHKGAHVGLVDGTGIGEGMALPDKNGIFWIYNTEIGELVSFPLSAYEQQVHTKLSINKRHLETIAGGDNMGEVLDAIIRDMVKQGIIPYNILPEKKFDSKYRSDILANNRKQFHEIFDHFDERDEETWSMLTEIANRLVERAAQALTIAQIALIRAYPQAFPDYEIIFPVEGSNFWKTVGFKDEVERNVNQHLTNHKVRFVETSGSLGAMFAALRYRYQR